MKRVAPYTPLALCTPTECMDSEGENNGVWFVILLLNLNACSLFFNISMHHQLTLANPLKNVMFLR